MKNERICIVGLGYVGLPLAHAFASKEQDVTGFDINAKRIRELKKGKDSTNELTEQQLKDVDMSYSDDPAVMEEADILILAIPTPVDDDNKPDLTLLKAATASVGEHIKKGSIVVFESTVYPGTTEEICGPILEEASGLKCGEDFFLGYSPERVNPGDKLHTIDKITKVVSAQDEKTLDTLCALYGSFTQVHRAPNIKVAEMAKAIENAQRDLNIAFVNEIAMLCHRIGIRSHDVLEAAGTKWNFLPFLPGLVGGHCIGVDPYYLVEKARQLGMDTKIITAGRSTNDGMSSYISKRIKDALKKDGARVLILGLTFKEDVPDTRNSKAPEVALQLSAMGCDTVVHDPFLSEKEILEQELTPGSIDDGPFDAIALLVPHKEYEEISTEEFIKATKEDGLIFDLKSMLNEEAIASKRQYQTL